MGADARCPAGVSLGSRETQGAGARSAVMGSSAGGTWALGRPSQPRGHAGVHDSGQDTEVGVPLAFQGGLGRCLCQDRGSSSHCCIPALSGQQHWPIVCPLRSPTEQRCLYLPPPHAGRTGLCPVALPGRRRKLTAGVGLASALQGALQGWGARPGRGQGSFLTELNAGHAWGRSRLRAQVAPSGDSAGTARTCRPPSGRHKGQPGPCEALTSPGPPSPQAQHPPSLWGWGMRDAGPGVEPQLVTEKGAGSHRC